MLSAKALKGQVVGAMLANIGSVEGDDRLAAAADEPAMK